MITATYLRERAAYYRQMAEEPDMLKHAESLRALAAAFARDADKIEVLHWAAVKELAETSMVSSFR